MVTITGPCFMSLYAGSSTGEPGAAAPHHPCQQHGSAAAQQLVEWAHPGAQHGTQMHRGGGGLSFRQCCGAGAARSRNFWLEPEPEYRSFGSGSGSAKVVIKNQIHIE
jgi:hypothetical protein